MQKKEKNNNLLMEFRIVAFIHILSVFNVSDLKCDSLRPNFKCNLFKAL